MLDWVASSGAIKSAIGPRSGIGRTQITQSVDCGGSSVEVEMCLFHMYGEQKHSPSTPLLSTTLSRESTWTRER